MHVQVSCVRVWWWPQRFAARLRPIISFFRTSLAFSGFLLPSPLRSVRPSASHRSLSLSSLLPQSRGPWALFAAAGLSPLCRSRATASKTLATRSALHLDRAGGQAGQLPSLLVVQVRPLSNSTLSRALLMRVASGRRCARFRSVRSVVASTLRACVARLGSFCAPCLIRQITVARHLFLAARAR